MGRIPSGVERRVEMLDALRGGERRSDEALLKNLRAGPTARTLPTPFDDADDISELIGPLAVEDRRRLGFPLPTRPISPPSPPPASALTPTYRVRVRAVLCTDDDGSGEAAGTNVIDPAYLAALLAETSKPYTPWGIEFVPDSAGPLEQVSSTMLNREFVTPTGWDLSRPEDHPPWQDVDTPEGGQTNWRQCHRCRGLFFTGHGSGVCPKGGAHDSSKAPDHDVSLIHDQVFDGQADWRWCKKCQGLFFAGNSAGVCPAGGGHDPSGSGNYRLLHNRPRLVLDVEPDDGWRWCKKCQGLFTSRDDAGVCPAGSNHDSSGSGTYTLCTQMGNLILPHALARQQFARDRRHSMVLLLSQGYQVKWINGWKMLDARTYAFSGSHWEFVALGPLKWLDLTGHAYLTAHEVGHYFHLWHTHGPGPETVADAAKQVREALENGWFSEADASRVFDGDWNSGVTDTPADPANGLFATVNTGDDACGPVDSVQIDVSYTNPTTNQPDETSLTLQPDRSNAMSYFKGCTNFVQTFSKQQGERMRAAIETHQSFDEVNRWHTCHPAMRLGALAPYPIGGGIRWAAIWRPSDEGEVQVYDWELGDVRSRYDELWSDGWRLKLLAPYPVGGDVRWAAVWHPSDEGEIQVYDWELGDVRSRYDELWPDGWRLKLLAPYPDDGGVRWAAVWHPSDEGEIQVYDWELGDVRSRYDELWPDGWRLKLLAPYPVDGGVRWAAVWHPSNEGEIQVYDWELGDVRSRYDELWPDGWRLKLLAPYPVDGGVRWAAVWHPSNEGEIQVYDWELGDVRSNYDKWW